MRDTLFGDRPLHQWPPDEISSEGMPWDTLVLARSHVRAGRESDAIACWRQIVQLPDLEPRHYLQAWHFLRQHGEQPPSDLAKQLLGVVVEVAMPDGLDLLAAYSDHSARYDNYSGAAVVWEHSDQSLDVAIDQLLEASKEVIGQIGPWDEKRPAPPSGDLVRLCFLTPSGLHFGQGPMAALSNDPLGGRVLELASVLMKALIAKTQ